jgi:hypothetical protein
MWVGTAQETGASATSPQDATQLMRLQPRKTGLAHSTMQVMIKN